MMKIKRLDYDKSEIILNIKSPTEEITRTNSCKKEPETIAWIENNMKKGDIFYDVGANIGAYSLVASKFTKGGIKVYAFEPSYSNFAQLCKNIMLNKCQDSIIPLSIPLSDKTAIGYFNYSSVESGTADHTFGFPINYKGKKFKPICRQLMLSYKIDDLVKHIDPPNYLKIDVDGIELSILRGADKTLSTPSVKSVLVEVVELPQKLKEREAIVAFLNSKGFKLESRNPYVYGVSPSSNYIFSRK